MEAGKFHIPKMVANICCFGGTGTGALTSCAIAYNCPEIKVSVLDTDGVITKWNSGSPPFDEPELERVLKKCQHRNLFFSSEYAIPVQEADLIFISVQSKVKLKGHGKGKTVDLKKIEDAARIIAMYGDSDKIVVEKSPEPGFSADKISLILNTVHLPGVRYQILSNPDFTSNDKYTLSDILHPERVLIGCSNNPQGRAAAESLRNVYLNWIPQKNILTVTTASAELARLASDCFLAQKFCSSHTLAEVSEETDVDFTEVADIVGMDSNIGPKSIRPSLGFSVFHLNLQSLVYLCECLRLYEVADYWKAVIDMTEIQKNRYVKKVKDVLGDVEDKVVCIWGFTYERNITTVKYSPALEVCQGLLSSGAKIQIYDPKVEKNKILEALNCSPENNKIIVCDTPYEAADKACAIIVCSTWEEFNKLDLIKIHDNMETPRVIDGRNFMNAEKLKKYGFEFYSDLLGKPQQ